MRAPFFTGSIIPVLLGAAAAYAGSKSINWLYFFLTLAGGMLIHAGANIANDYFDHIHKNDEVNTEYIRPFTGGSRLIQKGLLTPKEVLWEALICFGLGSAIGLFLTVKIGIVILLLGVIGVISAFFYTSYPFYFAKRGLGEIVIGLNFGILLCFGAYYVQTQQFSWVPVVASVPIALLITAVLYINEFPDYNADIQAGRNHLLARLGRKKGVNAYILMLLFTYISVLFGVAINVIPLAGVFALLTVPIAVKSIIVLKKHYDEPGKLTPSCASTIILHLFIGLILFISYLV